MASDHDIFEKDQTPAQLEAMQQNLARAEELTQRLMAALSKKADVNPALEGPGQDLYMKTGAALWSQMVTDPAKIYETQVGYWAQTLQHFVDMQQAMVAGHVESPAPEIAFKDRRFANPLWRTHPYFSFVRQQYQTNADAMRSAVSAVEDLDDKDRQRLTYFTDQIIDMLAPTNFLATNPDALERAVETEGESLVKGLENLVRDLEANDGDLLVTLAEKDAFELGKNIATTPGEVVYRNRLLELIQYTPKTETVHKTPLVIFPPWINKFYILDLKPANSLINWIVEQGYTVFVVSWVNPDESYADISLEDYIEEGYLTTINEVKSITGEPEVNAIGYCIAGTTLSMTLALMKKRGDTSVKSATFFTTLTDFSDQGEFAVFLQDDFVDGIERQIDQDGILKSYFMSRTFSYLRSNDLIYGPAIKSYMMGEAPPAFDLLYWNGDSTNLPGCMAKDYLRKLCQKNRFADGGIELFDELLQLGDIDVPVCAIGCETDHIAPWRASFEGIRQFGSRSKIFIMSESGHIAGIINPPSKKKYGHYTNTGPLKSAEEWLASAKFNDGSWWPRWEKWLSAKSGEQVPARLPGDSNHPPLCPAPGIYVKNLRSD